MNLLVLDSSTQTVALGLRVGGQIFSADASIGSQHAEYILPTLEALLYQSGAALSNIAGIVLGRGPGGFTGVRIGCALAQSLAFACELPMLPVSSLAALAYSVDAPRVLTCLDARMGEVYAAAYVDGVEVLAPCVAKPEHLPALSGEFMAVGTGALAYRDALIRQFPAVIFEEISAPSTAGLLRYADAHPNDWCAPDTFEILYLRDKVAMTIKERREHGLS